MADSTVRIHPDDGLARLVVVVIFAGIHCFSTGGGSRTGKAGLRLNNKREANNTEKGAAASNMDNGHSSSSMTQRKGPAHTREWGSRKKVDRRGRVVDGFSWKGRGKEERGGKEREATMW
jgi:hypothetical protein